MDKTIIFFLCFYFCSAKIKINRLDVPPAILYGSQNDVTLDCDFDSGGDTVTEIKWFLDGDTQIYQWLPTTNTKARAIGKLKNHIDVDYKATDDEQTMYRALRIKDLSPEFSGNYTCKVSGPMSEDVETKSMIIYVTPEDLDDDDDDYDDDDDILDLTISETNSEIFCSAGGFFPQPNMTLYIINDNENETIFQQDDETIFRNEDDYYNVSAVLKYDVTKLSKTFHYICELNIPGTPYNISENLMYSLEESSETQVEEDLFNSTNSTDSFIETTTEIETQIEEETFNSTTETSTNSEEDVTTQETKINNESAAIRHLPTFLPYLLLISFLGLFYS